MSVVFCCCCSINHTVMTDSVTSWTAAHQASLSLTSSRSLPKFMSIVLMMLSSQLILWCPLLLLSSVPPTIRDFSNELAVLIRWPNTRASAFASVLPLSIQGCFPLRLTGLILLSKELPLGVFCTDLLNIRNRNSK